jgi:hypothetical protein
MKFRIAAANTEDVFDNLQRFGRQFTTGREQTWVLDISATATDTEWIVTLRHTIPGREWKTKQHQARWRIVTKGEWFYLTIPKPTSQRMREFVDAWAYEVKRGWAQ